ncbi:MAG: PAS domain-containing protein [Pyrinomonadaceae bacterium]
MRAQGEFQQELLRNFPNGSVNVFDRDFRYLLAEGMGLESIGLSSQHLVGKTLAEVFPKNEVEHARRFFERAFAGEEVEFEVFTAGQIYTTRTVPLSIQNSHINAILVVSQNSTQRKQAEVKLLQCALCRSRILVAFIQSELSRNLTTIAKKSSRLTKSL